MGNTVGGKYFNVHFLFCFRLFFFLFFPTCCKRDFYLDNSSSVFFDSGCSNTSFNKTSRLADLKCCICVTRWEIHKSFMFLSNLVKYLDQELAKPFEHRTHLKFLLLTLKILLLLHLEHQSKGQKEKRKILTIL